MARAFQVDRSRIIQRSRDAWDELTAAQGEIITVLGNIEDHKQRLMELDFKDKNSIILDMIHGNKNDQIF